MAITDGHIKVPKIKFRRMARHVQVLNLDTAGIRVHVKVKKDEKPHGGIGPYPTCHVGARFVPANKNLVENNRTKKLYLFLGTYA